MISLPRFLALLPILVALLQVTRTLAGSAMDCMTASVETSLAMDLQSATLSAYDYTDIQEVVNACERQGADCTVDASTYSGDGDKAFTTKCTGVGGKVFEYDIAYTCTDNGADKSIRVNNVKECMASICTSENVNELSVSSLSYDSLSCTGTAADVHSGSIMLGVSSTMFIAAVTGMLVLFSEMVSMCQNE